MDRVQRASDDLFSTIHAQAKSIVGERCGFYVVSYDAERDSVRVAYSVDEGRALPVGALFEAARCEAITRQEPVIDDTFTQLIAGDVRHSILVPMIRANVVLGAFGVYTREEKGCNDAHAKPLAAIAELAAHALENAVLVAVVEKARMEAERIEQIGRAILGSLELSEVLHRVTEAALELLEADSATVWLLRDEHEVEVAMATGEFAPPVGHRMPVPPVLWRRMAEMRKPYFIYEDLKGAHNDLPFDLRNLTAAKSTMAVVMMSEDRALGALAIGHKERVRYTPSDIHMLERLAFQAAIAVTNARLHEDVRNLSMTDPLTEMPNRRNLDMFLEKEFAAAKRGRLLSVLLFDLDHFKTYNDRMGHQAGDAVLRAFARVLIAETRAMNLAARYGGDEFITILADTDPVGAQAHAERIMREIEKDATLTGAGIVASVGMASYDPSMETFADLIRAADRDLYGKKSSRTGGA